MLVALLASRLCIQLHNSLMQLDLEATPLSVPDMLAVAVRPCPETVCNLHEEKRLGKNKNTKGRKGSSLVVMVCGRDGDTHLTPSQRLVTRQRALMLKDLQHFSSPEECEIPPGDL